LVQWDQTGTLPAAADVAAPLGPTEERGSAEGGLAKVGVVAEAARQALATLAKSGHVPSSVPLAGREANPAALFTAAAAALQALLAGLAADATVTWPSGRLTLEDCVGRNERDMWGWVIFPEGFNPVDLLDLTRLQTWTIKPAALR
jgi:hypothetical protein